jgi:hypothetical protein
MKHLIVKVKSVTVPELYRIKVTFDDATERTINLERLLYGPLKDPVIFKAVKVDTEASTVVWPSGADFDPATLYQWDSYVSEIKECAIQWNIPK